MEAVEQEEDEDEEISVTLAGLRAMLTECVCHNTPTPLPVQAVMTSAMNEDADSVSGLVKPSQSSNQDRYEAKLHLMCVPYTGEDGIGLLDLNDSVRKMMALKKVAQAEAFCNLLAATGGELADTMDAINRKTDWPAAYHSTP